MKSMHAKEMTAPVKKEKHKVQLLFSDDSIADLDNLKDLMAASARADVIRNSLRWMLWCADEVSRGTVILVERDGKQREVVFPFVKREAVSAQGT